MRWYNKRCVTVAVSLLITPICLFLDFASAGAGHGDNSMGCILFTYTDFLRGKGALTTPLYMLEVVQFPVYGLIVGLAWTSNRFRLRWAVLSVVAAHWLVLLPIMSTHFLATTNNLME
jgi:hypothetical protein